MSEYSYDLADAIGNWGLHNQPLFEQFRNTPWDEIPELAQVQVAKRLRTEFREAAVKRAIANNAPASSIACKPEFPNCFNVAGNLDVVGAFYSFVVATQDSLVGKAAESVARGRMLDVTEQWSRIDQLDQRLQEFFAMLPRSAILAEFQYPPDPPEVARCHLARRHQQPQPKRRVCTDPQTEAERRAAADATPPTPFSVYVRDIGDLDDDGRDEFVVDRSSRTALSTTLLGTDRDGCAHEIIVEGDGVIHQVLGSRTLNWKDLEIGLPLNRTAENVDACWLRFQAKFDGKRYRLANVLRVESFDGTENVADLGECRKQAEDLIEE